MIDNGYSIIGYESSKFNLSKDSFYLLLIYKVQLNAYAMIAESIGLKPVKQVGLIYYMPQIDVIQTTTDVLNKLISHDNFLVGFGNNCFEIELKPDGVVRPLLKKLENYGS